MANFAGKSYQIAVLIKLTLSMVVIKDRDLLKIIIHKMGLGDFQTIKWEEASTTINTCLHTTTKDNSKVL